MEPWRRFHYPTHSHQEWVLSKTMPIDAAPSIGLDDLWCQLSDMAKPAHPERGIAVSDVRKSGLCFGFFGLLFNHHNMLGQRSTLEWSRHDYPL